MKSLALTDLHFSEEHPTLKEYIAKTAHEQQLQTVVITVDKKIYNYLDGQKYYNGFIAEKEVDGKIEMTFLSESLEGFARWFIMYGDQAEIITPDSLKDRVREIADAVMQKLRPQ